MRRCVGLVPCCSIRSSRSSSYLEDVFQGRMSTRSGRFAFCLRSGSAFVFWQIVSLRIKTPSSTSLVASRNVKREKGLTSV